MMTYFWGPHQMEENLSKEMLTPLTLKVMEVAVIIEHSPLRRKTAEPSIFLPLLPRTLIEE